LGSPASTPEFCTCLALRQAARHVSQFYDQHLAPCGLRITQFSILAKLKSQGPLTINRLAELLVIDRTTLGRTIVPLQRDGLISTAQGVTDRRSKALDLTPAGQARLEEAWTFWSRAQAEFESAFGPHEDAELRLMMRSVTVTDLDAAVDEA
jgi:DNA-binding MarR family transcriptional regulator